MLVFRLTVKSSSKNPICLMKKQRFHLYQDGKKYHLSTYTIDLLTGKRKNLKVDYLIHDLETFLNEEGVGVYGYGEISRIGADNLLGSPLICHH